MRFVDRGLLFRVCAADGQVCYAGCLAKVVGLVEANWYVLKDQIGQQISGRHPPKKHAIETSGLL